MYYASADSRLASFFVIKGYPLVNTEIKYRGDDDRVQLYFEIPDDKLAELKREFFEGGVVPALEYANALKSTMFAIRQARELARESEISRS